MKLTEEKHTWPSQDIATKVAIETGIDQPKRRAKDSIIQPGDETGIVRKWRGVVGQSRK